MSCLDKEKKESNGIYELLFVIIWRTQYVGIIHTPLAKLPLHGIAGSTLYLVINIASILKFLMAVSADLSLYS